MREKILLALNDVNENNYVDKIINSFSYEERLNFFEDMYTTRDQRIYNNLKYIFTREEVFNLIHANFGLKNFTSMLNSNNRKYLVCLFNSLNMSDKVNGFFELERSVAIYMCNYIFNTDELRIEFLEFVGNSKINNKNLNDIIYYVLKEIKDEESKIKSINRISNIYPIEDLYRLINNISEEEFIHYFNDLDLNDLTKSMLILRCPNSKLSLEYLKELNSGTVKINASKRFSDIFIQEVNADTNNKIMLDADFSFEDIKNIIFTFEKSGDKILALLNYSDDIKYKFLPLLSEEENIRLLINMSKPDLVFSGLSYLKRKSSVIRVLTFYKGGFPKYNESYNELLSLYSEISEVNKEHLIELSKIVSLEIIKYLSNKSIVSLLNMNSKDFNKFLSFFNNANIIPTSYKLNNMLGAFASKAADLKLEKILTYYSTTIYQCSKGMEREAKNTLNAIFRGLSEDKINGYTVDSIYKLLVNKDENAIKELRNICDYYINVDRKRNDEASFQFRLKKTMHYYDDVLLLIEKGLNEEAKSLLFTIFIDIQAYERKLKVDSMYQLLSENNEQALKDFHSICNSYIKISKEKETKRLFDKYNSEFFAKVFESISSIREIMNRYDPEWLYTNYFSKMMNIFNDKEKQLLEDKELFNKIYEFKLDKSKEIDPSIKSSIFVFDRIMDKFFHTYKEDDTIVTFLENSSAKTIVEIPDVDTTFLIKIMSYMNAKELKEKLLDNDKSCKEVREALKKYGFLAFNEKYKIMQTDADVYCDAETVSSVFLNYEDIIHGLNETHTPINILSILNGAGLYNKSSNIYRSIFGEENYKYILFNPPPLKGTGLRSERLEESVVSYARSYNRSRVSVEPIDENLEINGKKINAVLGNFTNPDNFTLGEKTESCMRIGGVGEKLYEFCINNDNAFHIVFTNPETGELIGRVSGFRNGNTVFLNQLKEKPSYVDNSDDLVASAKEVADKMIKMSVSSGYPIENVFISPTHCMVGKNFKKTYINISKSDMFRYITEDDDQYFDLEPERLIVLATTSKEKYAPIKLGTSNMCYYPVIRDKVRVAKNATEAVNHINTIEQLFSGKRFDEIVISDEKYETCYYGEDWYVAIDKKGNISKKIMSKSKDFEQAFKEMYEVLEILEKDENKLSKK